MPAIMFTQQAVYTNNDLAVMKAMNIDVVMNYHTQNVYWANGGVSAMIAYLTSELDAYHAAGLKGLILLSPVTETNPPKYTELAQVVTAIKDHPALYGWYTEDEPELWGVAPSVVADVYDAIKSVDPAHPIIVVYPGYGQQYPSSLGSRKMCDVFGIDNYPIMATPGNPPVVPYYGSEISLTYDSVPSWLQSRLINLIQVWAEGVTTTDPDTDEDVTAPDFAIPTPDQINSMAATSRSVGWDTGGIAFWLWHWDDRLGQVSTLDGNTAAQAAVAALAAQYHKNLYGPSVATFTLLATSTSLTVPVTTLTATDDVGVTGYLITESATQPLATDAGWSSTAPTSYTVASAGTHTLYAWAKDADGNVSAGVSASVVVANTTTSSGGITLGGRSATSFHASHSSATSMGGIILGGTAQNSNSTSGKITVSGSGGAVLGLSSAVGRGVTVVTGLSRIVTAGGSKVSAAIGVATSVVAVSSSGGFVLGGCTATNYIRGSPHTTSTLFVLRGPGGVIYPFKIKT